MESRIKLSNAIPTPWFRKWLRSNALSGKIGRYALFRVQLQTEVDWMMPIQVIYGRELDDVLPEEAALDLVSNTCLLGVYDSRDGRFFEMTSCDHWRLWEGDCSYEPPLVWLDFADRWCHAVAQRLFGDGGRWIACGASSWETRPTEEAVARHFVKTRSLSYPMPGGEPHRRIPGLGGRIGFLAAFADWDLAFDYIADLWMEKNNHRVEGIRECYRGWCEYVSDKGDEITSVLGTSSEVFRVLMNVCSRTATLVFDAEGETVEVEEDVGDFVSELQNIESVKPTLPVDVSNWADLDAAGLLVDGEVEASRLVGVKVGGEWVYKGSASLPGLGSEGE